MKPLARLPWLTLLGTATALALGAAAPATTVALEFSRAGLVHGEWWRLLTGHFTHCTVDHLAWDVAAFLALGSFVELASRRIFVRLLFGSALAVSVGVFFLAPEFASYRGLSGIDSALFAAASLILLRRAHAVHSWFAAALPAVALLGFLGKVAYESATGATLFVTPSADFVAVPLAHLLGALVGGAVVTLSSVRSPDGGLRPAVPPTPGPGAQIPSSSVAAAP